MTDTEILDIIAPLAERLDRLCDGVERLIAVIKPSELAEFRGQYQSTGNSVAFIPSPARTVQDGPAGPEPPHPANPEFRASRDLPAEPFLPFKQWECPIHHSNKVVPAGISKKNGKPYEAFLACAEYGCNEKPPRAPR
jgi:hypothetical protein